MTVHRVLEEVQAAVGRGEFERRTGEAATSRGSVDPARPAAGRRPDVLVQITGAVGEHVEAAVGRGESNRMAVSRVGGAAVLARERSSAPRTVAAAGAARRHIGRTTDAGAVRAVEGHHRAVVATRSRPHLEVDVSDVVVVGRKIGVGLSGKNCADSLTRRHRPARDRTVDVRERVATTAGDVDAEVAVAGLVVVHRAVDRRLDGRSGGAVVAGAATVLDEVKTVGGRPGVRAVVVALAHAPRLTRGERRQDVAICRSRRRGRDDQASETSEHEAQGHHDRTEALVCASLCCSELQETHPFRGFAFGY